MVNKSGNIGTATETAVVRYLIDNGWPTAERRRLRGAKDCGDITGTPGIVWEIKGGNAARRASDNQVAAWLDETETERANARAFIGVLVVARKGIGATNAGAWWAVLNLTDVAMLLATDNERAALTHMPPIITRLHLADACHLLRVAGYGTPAPEEPTDLAALTEGLNT